MRAFPLRFMAWRGRMLWNAVRSRSQTLALAGAAALLALSGGGAMALRLGEGLAQLAERGPEEVERAVALGGLALYLVMTLMALANVITRFFGDARLTERESLMGPLPPGALFTTELLDALRLPLVFVVGFGLVPLTVGALRLGAPAPVVLSLWAVGGLIFLQPTLAVMAGAIAVVRLLPRALVGRGGMLFLVMLASAGLLFAGIGALRGLLQGAAIDTLALAPTHQVALILPGFLRGDGGMAWGSLARAGLPTLALLIAARWLYLRHLLGDLDRFRLTAVADAGGEGGRGVSFRLLARIVGRPVAAVVVKDLRSSRRDTAQRVAFTLMAALITALVLGDLVSGSRLSPLFGPIFVVYALFLVATQGLSTFSAEGGVLENLARLPVGAEELLRAKVLSHFLLFMGVIAVVVALLLVAPVPLPWIFQAAGAALLGVAFVPVAAVLSLLTVTLGAIFPKPGEGGAQKEISVFAMGLFLHLGALMAVSLGAGVAAVALGPLFALIPLGVAAAWLGVLALLWALARRSVARAMGERAS